MRSRFHFCLKTLDDDDFDDFDVSDKDDDFCDAVSVLLLLALMGWSSKRFSSLFSFS